PPRPGVPGRGEKRGVTAATPAATAPGSAAAPPRTADPRFAPPPAAARMKGLTAGAPRRTRMPMRAARRPPDRPPEPPVPVPRAAGRRLAALLVFAALAVAP